VRILVLGGSWFAGRVVVEEAVRRGLNVTVFNRGRSEDLASRGDGDDEDLVAFLYAGAESEYPGSVSIDVEDAFAAAREYASTGQRPTNLAWQTV
jgi:nucleoside-diphosphate-sugar epimerase